MHRCFSCYKKLEIVQAPEKNLKSDTSRQAIWGSRSAIDPRVEEHIRLAVGSQIAGELRTALYEKLGLTGSAGIATNKTLSKLVSGVFKPNQQTTLLPESTALLLSCLEHLKKLPGVGYRTAQKLQSLGLSRIQDLQVFPLATLEKVLGAVAAQRIHSLSHGVDEAPVTPSGPPQCGELPTATPIMDLFSLCSKPPVPVGGAELLESDGAARNELIDDYLTDCMKSNKEAVTCSSGYSSSKHHGPVEALKQMLFSLQSVEQRFSQEQIDQHEEITAIKQV
ncbi:UNVERIFIED_CONTAM: hypothetical protein FKN15_003373 [Acipenser sinensis]